jgi:hypothetical protein
MLQSGQQVSLQGIEVELKPDAAGCGEHASSCGDLISDFDGSADCRAQVPRQDQDDGQVKKTLDIEPARNSLFCLNYPGQPIVGEDIVNPFG